MKSKTFVTLEMDAPAIAAQELCQQITDSFPLLKNSVGLLFTYSDMEADMLVKELQTRAGIPIIGATAIASMDETEGFHEMSAMLLVLTADDCEFSISVSDPVTSANIKDSVTQAYRQAVSGLNETPALVYAIPPYQLDIMLDAYTDIFTKIAPKVPFIGGLPSYNGNGDENLTIGNGETYRDRMVMLAISGNIRPVFSVQTVMENDDTKKRRVTEAHNNVIYKVDDISFTDYLIERGLPLKSIADINSTVSFVANPLLVEDTREGFGSDFKYLRTLHEVNMETGSGTAIGRIPQGSYISVHPINRDEIGEAALKGIDGLTKQMSAQAGDGYEYTTILAISCIGRYVIMTPNGDVETTSILKKLPEGINLAGFYSYGEISPLPTPDGLVSFSHNESLVLCAF